MREGEGEEFVCYHLKSWWKYGISVNVVDDASPDQVRRLMFKVHVGTLSAEREIIINTLLYALENTFVFLHRVIYHSYTSYNAHFDCFHYCRPC